MKKLLLSTICVVCFGLSANAKETAVLVEQKTPKIYDLIKIQIPNTYLKSGELNVTDEQRAKIMKLVKPLMHDVYQAKMNEAYGLEKRVQRDILQGKSKEDVKDMLDKIAQIKREAIDVKLEVIAHFKSVLNDEQWNTFLKLSK
ncbi:MAG: hypothetical protein GX118_07885 [Arcobacter butzleri]|jgi:Spy/CpxP family protein refolding chaperone|nr:hypothetical protein [Arcobacteraceae bacterium]NLO18092.1 hypothetical protein [Aliarcobacter butzleri]